ncbi:MAG: protein kinase [Desulfohalobiaceae bacterium]|nr:protein kinase [Desulfohalobiaceae bacterium]
MPASVTITCLEGPLKGQSFEYRERASVLIGRAEDCAIRIPNTDATKKISRHHSLVELSPPLTRIRDFGSLNGTYVNCECIGARDPSRKSAKGSPDASQRDLVDGDSIRVGTLVFTVSVYAPESCGECGEEIPEAEEQEAKEETGRNICTRCRSVQEEKQRRQEREVKEREARQQAERAKQQAPQAQKARAKAVQAKPLGKNGPQLSPKPGAVDPEALIKAILERARQGAPEVQNIKGYTILKTLGKGGMGAVYLARKEGGGPEVALKVMLPRVAASKEAAVRFQREMANAKALQHPNIVQTYETGFDGNIFYLTMEVCNGGTVQDLLQRNQGKLSFDQSVDIILQACEGLEYMHEADLPEVKLVSGRSANGKGLVHRDLKPANLFLHETSGRLQVKIADLGLAKAFDQAGLSGLTMTGQVAGSPPFMPRQQVVDYLYAKPEVDVWALAATFYTLLTGKSPRDFPPGKDIWLNILQSDPVPIRRRDPAIPKKLAKVIDRALVDKPRIGISSIADFSRKVRQAL